MSVESARMSDLDFLVPSALVEPGLASELLRDQSLPTLERLVARSGIATTFDVPSRASPNAWQAVVFGLRAGADLACINVAELWATACGAGPSTAGRRFVAEPAHFKVANDHLRLDDPAGLAVTLDEARALASSIEPVLTDAGWRLAPIDAATMTHWMLTRHDGTPLSAATIERAIGDNVADWQPRGADDAALAWRRCVNEIQMTWFAHPVNAAREAEGRPTINTLWLSGNGEPPGPLPRYRAVTSGLPLLAALPPTADAPRVLESFDGFIGPARREDWSGWRAELQSLESRLAAVVAMQKQGAVATLTLILCGQSCAKLVTVRPGDARKFWRDWSPGPSLALLFGEGRAA